MASRPRSSGDGGVHGPDSEYHRPVLVDEVMTYLVGGPGVYLDGTVGGGGHGAALLERCAQCSLLALDRDPEALETARQRLAPFADRVRFEHLSFQDAGHDAEVRAGGLAGALLDLGVSSRQLDSDQRGFTFRRGAPLDMRMDAGSAITAATFLAGASRAELVRVLRVGNAPRPAPLAARIVRRRAARPLLTSDDLVAVLESALGRRADHAEKARLFQALRIHVNGEIAALQEALPAIRDLLLPGAAFVVISYHSVEDRVVKRAFRDWSDRYAGLPPRLPVRATEVEARGSLLTRKPVTPSEAEIEANSRARPARLRAWRRAA